MIDEKVLSELAEIAPIKINEPLKSYTSFRIGGPAAAFAEPEEAIQIAQLLKICREEEIPYYIMGNGSDLLVGDKGYPGLIIRICQNRNRIQVGNREILAGAGALLSVVAARARDNALTGMEGLSGIPGTIGGACVMNAGAYGTEMKDVLKTVSLLTPEGNIMIMSARDLKLGYRTSIIPEKKYILLDVRLELEKGSIEEIKEKMADFTSRRTEKQPLELPSAGSTFKRPEGYFAGKLIMDCGLRGYRVGDAQVSEKHCGFVVNRGNATALQVRQLIRDIQERVLRETGVQLEPEVKFLGEF